MNNQTIKVIHPFQMVKEAIVLWRANIIPLVAINSAMAMANKLLSGVLGTAGPVQDALESGEINFIVAVFLGVFVIASFLINSFLILVALNVIKRNLEKKAFLFNAVRDAFSRLVPFLKASLLLLCFVFICRVAILGGPIIIKVIYALMIKNLGHGLALGALLGTSTIFVVLAISSAWYGFFFSLAPLVAAYENKTVASAFRVSRERVRGGALRYLCAMVFCVVIYFFIGLVLYVGLMKLTGDAFILAMIDPVMMVVFGPLHYVIWYVSYKKLTELKAEKN